MSATLDPVPLDAPIAQTAKATETWLNWFLNLATVLAQTARRLIAVPVLAASAAIGAAPLPTGALVSGLYRVTVYARIVQAATTSSALTVRIGFTDGAIACLFSGVSLTGNTTATVQTNTYLLRADAPGVLTYSTLYASVGGTPMKYDLQIVVEQI